MKSFLHHTLGIYSSSWTRTLLLAQAPCHLKFPFRKWRPKMKNDMVYSVQWKVAKITSFSWKNLLCISTLQYSQYSILFNWKFIVLKQQLSPFFSFRLVHIEVSDSLAFYICTLHHSTWFNFVLSSLLSGSSTSLFLPQGFLWRPASHTKLTDTDRSNILILSCALWLHCQGTGETQPCSGKQ